MARAMRASCSHDMLRAYAHPPTNPPTQQPTGPYGCVRTRADPYASVRTRTDQYGPVRTRTDPYGRVRTRTDQYGPVRTRTDQHPPSHPHNRASTHQATHQPTRTQCVHPAQVLSASLRAPTQTRHRAVRPHAPQIAGLPPETRTKMEPGNGLKTHFLYSVGAARLSWVGRSIAAGARGPSASIKDTLHIYLIKLTKSGSIKNKTHRLG